MQVEPYLHPFYRRLITGWRFLIADIRCLGSAAESGLGVGQDVLMTDDASAKQDLAKQVTGLSPLALAGWSTSAR
jgi:hypothetical protein